MTASEAALTSLGADDRIPFASSHDLLPIDFNEMFAWLFHRVSGLLLIVLLGMQMVTGVLQLVKESPGVAESARKLHMNGFCMALAAFLIIMHAMYGLRTVLYDVGVRKERLLFWVCTACGVVLSVVYLWFFFRLA